LEAIQQVAQLNTRREYISHVINVAKELDGHFNFPNIYFMSHLVIDFRSYGALQQDYAERHEHAHQTNLKNGWNASNHNLNYLLQVITFQLRVLCFVIREIKFSALT
jgi:hypothetical protein